MKQPHTITEHYWLFPWNFKKASAIFYGVAEAYVSRNRLQKAGDTAPAFSAALPQNMAAPSPRHGEDRAFFVGSVRVYGCFISVYDEKRGFFFNFLADGLHDWGILLGIPLEFQEIKHQPLPMAQPFCFGSVIGGIHLFSMMKIRPFSPIYSVGGLYG